MLLESNGGISAVRALPEVWRASVSRTRIGNFLYRVIWRDKNLKKNVRRSGAIPTSHFMVWLQ